jgi:protein-S-isoprenylcysteine O-methyltransferase Ste14
LIIGKPNMRVLSILTIAWLLFVAYWWISAMGVKKNVRRRSLRREVGIRILALAVIVALVRFPGSRAFLARASPAVNSTQAGAGLILCLAGFALAVWARLHLGRNWGMPMTFKEGHDLVTGGPYRYIRHPIYTGMLLAVFGTAGFFASRPSVSQCGHIMTTERQPGPRWSHHTAKAKRQAPVDFP